MLKKLHEAPIQGVETILISPHQFQYDSRMFPEYIEGIYGEDEIRVDLKKMADKGKVKWIEDAVTAIDPEQKMVLTAQGDVISYDAISFNIGSLTANTDIPGVLEYTYRIKPNYHFVNMVSEVRDTGNVVIVGGNTDAIEMSLALKAWRMEHKITSSVTLLSSERLLQNESSKTSRKVQSILESKGIHLLTEETVNQVTDKKVGTISGVEVPYDKVIWVNGIKAPGLFRASRLPTDDDGYLKVEETLQVREYPSIFAVGDCTSLSDHKNVAQKEGFDFYQGEVLYENIKGFFDSGIGVTYQPAKRRFSILSLSNKEGLAIYKSHSFKGHWAWRMKQKLNQRNMKRYLN